MSKLKVSAKEHDASLKMTRVLMRRANKPAAKRKDGKYDEAQDKANKATKDTMVLDKPFSKEAKSAHKKARDAHREAADIAPTPTLERIHMEMAATHAKVAKQTDPEVLAARAAMAQQAAAAGPGDTVAELVKPAEVTETTPAAKKPAKKAPAKPKPKGTPANPSGADLEPGDLGG